MYKKTDVRWREEDDGIIIFCPRRARIFRLNDTAAEIWKILDQQSASEIAEQIAKIYGVTSSEIFDDITTCLNELKNLELIDEYHN